MVPTDFGRLRKGDVVQVIHLPSSPWLVDKRGVVKVVGNGLVTIVFLGKLHLGKKNISFVN